MKTITFPLMISFLVVAITASAVVYAEEEVVLDVKGNPVKANTPYRVMRKTGCTISMYSFPNVCTKGVAVYKDHKPTGPYGNASIVFVSSSQDVRVSTKLNVKFKILPKLSHSCSESLFWRVDPKNSCNEELLLLGGSKSRNDSMFTIERSNNHFYKFAFGGAVVGMEKENPSPNLRRMLLLRDSDVFVEFGFLPLAF